MFEKFNFYDFLGYLLPGAAVVFLVYFVVKSAFGIPLPSLPSDLSGSFVFLGVSYITGHIVQAFGSWYEEQVLEGSKSKELTRRVRLGERLLLIDGPDALSDTVGFDPELRRAIRSAADEVFGKRSESEIFDLCQALIAQRSFAQRSEIYTAQKGLTRGMLVASVVAILLMAVVALQQLSRNDTLELAFTVVAIAVLVPIALLFGRAFDRFREYFSKSVYWAFLAWYSEQKFDRSKGAPTA